MYVRIISGLIGSIITLLLLAIFSYAAVLSGYIPANADAKPGALEKWAARTSLRATLLRLAPPADAPILPNDANLTAGAKLYAANCSICHGTSNGRPSTIAVGLYQKPPQFAKDGVDDDPVSTTYWKIRHGIRLTGMPAYSPSLSEKQSWQIALFLKNLPALSPHAEKAWRAMIIPGAYPLKHSSRRRQAINMASPNEKKRYSSASASS